MLLPVATEFDEENNTLFAETDELGTYCVLDMEVLLQTFGVNPDGSQTEHVETQMYSAPTDSDEYCVTFVFDIRKGRINAGQLENLKAEVREFAETVFAEGRNVSIRIMTQDSSDFDGESYDLIDECDDMVSLNKAMSQVKVSKYEGDLGNYCVITDAIAETVNSADTSVNNYVFTLFDQTNSVFEQNIAEELGNKAKKNGINISVITPSFEELVGFQKTICNVTGGIMIDTFSDFANDVYKHIFDETYEPKELPPEPQKEFDAILITGYERITLDSILYPNGENPTGKDSDTDKDGRTDWNEVDVERWENAGLISREDDGYINLPTLQQCMDYSDKSYVEEGLGRFISQPTISLMLNDIRVMPITSDPTREDSDGDNINDRLDPHKLIGTDIYTPCIDDNGKYGVENHLLKFHTNSDGIRSYYCQNCDYEVVAPEEEDIVNLYYDDYLIIVALEKMHTLVLNNGDLINANIIYSSIDRIRMIRAIHKYSYCDSNGDYVSPLNICIDESNDYYIHINSYETTDLNRRLKLDEKVFVYGGKIVIDYLCLTPGFPPALAIAWTVVSELGMALYEQREYDVTSVPISSFFTCIGGGFTDSLYGFNIQDPLHPGKPLGDDILSGTFLVFSLINQYGIANTYDHALEFKEDTRQFAISVSIQNTIAEVYLGLNLDNNEITKHTFRYYERDENLPYSNALSISVDSDIIRDYDFITYIVGDKYYTYR